MKPRLVSLASLANQLALGIPYLCLPRVEHHTYTAFPMDSGTLIPVLTLSWQML